MEGSRLRLDLMRSDEHYEHLNVNRFQGINRCSRCSRLIIIHAERIQYNNAGWNVSGWCPTCAWREESIYSAEWARNARGLPQGYLQPVFQFKEFGWAPPHLSCVDVGKGDCLVMRLGPVLVIYDTGYVKKAYKVFAEIERPEYATALHCLLIVSHEDNDHSGNYDGLLQRLQNKFAYVNVVSESAPMEENVLLCHVDTYRSYNRVGFHMGQIRLTCFLAPPSITNKNNRSIIVVIEHGQWISVLTGDNRLTRVEEVLDDYYPGRPIHTFQVPHHGSEKIYVYRCTLPQALYYVVSGLPKNEKGRCDGYNGCCQVEVVKRAAHACRGQPFNICFTQPCLTYAHVAQLSSRTATMLVSYFEAIRINL